MSQKTSPTCSLFDTLQIDLRQQLDFEYLCYISKKEEEQKHDHQTKDEPTEITIEMGSEYDSLGEYSFRWET